MVVSICVVIKQELNTREQQVYARMYTSDVCEYSGDMWGKTVAIDVLAFPRRLLRHLVRDVFRPEVLVVNVTCYVLQILHVRTAM